MELSPGEVWWAAPDPSVGREQTGRRPVVIISNADYLDAVTTLALVCPVTTTGRGWPNHVLLSAASGLDQPSYAMTEQIKVISRERLVLRAGSITDACLEDIRQWVRDFLVD